MTDNEIIKALECCKEESCIRKECPMRLENRCIEKTCKLSLDLINRQKAKNEDLKMLLIRSQAIIHRLNDSIMKEKAEAIREFAERLKKELNNIARVNIDDYDYFCISLGFVDNLVKEMVGETE